jgi:uncharacterized protein YcbX
VTARATVAKLSIAPVKSTSLHHPDEIRLERWGVPGNREFLFVNDRGRLFSGSRFGPLVAVRARYDADADRLTLALPDGSVADGPVRLSDEPISVDVWGREVPAREVVGPWAGAVSRFAGQPVRLLKPDRPGDGNDGSAASIVSTASIEELTQRSGRPEARDGRRFRMLVEVAGVEPHEEDTWVGREVALGGAVVRVTRPNPRCVVTTQSPDTGVKDLDTLREIRGYRGTIPDGGIPFGVYADVVEPGRVRVGDPAGLR